MYANVLLSLLSLLSPTFPRVLSRGGSEVTRYHKERAGCGDRRGAVKPTVTGESSDRTRGKGTALILITDYAECAHVTAGRDLVRGDVTPVSARAIHPVVIRIRGICEGSF